MDEAQCTRLTFELALAAASTLARLNPQIDSYRWLYSLTGFLPHALMSRTVHGAGMVGRATLAVARHDEPKVMPEAADIGVGRLLPQDDHGWPCTRTRPMMVPPIVSCSS
jgi:hypothetical protein